MPVLELLPFYCPIESAIHPRVGLVEERAKEWLDRFEIGNGPTQRAWLLGTNSAEFYARITPYGAEERLQSAVNWVYWGFALDDARCDEGITSSRTGSFVHMASQLLRVLEGRQLSSALTDPFEVALADIVADFRRCSTPTQVRRWVHAHRGWLFAVAWEVSKTEARTPSSVESYLARRLNCCGGEPTTAMIEIVNGGEVPSKEMDSPAVLALTEATRMVAALDNDLVSFRKESRFEDVGRNIMTVVAREYRCSPEEALVRSTAIRDRVMSLFLRLRDRVLPHASQELRTYVDCLGHTIRGNIEWSLKVPRYNSLSHRDRMPIAPTAVSANWSDRPSDESSEPLPVPTIAWWWEQLT